MTPGAESLVRLPGSGAQVTVSFTSLTLPKRGVPRLRSRTQAQVIQQRRYLYAAFAEVTADDRYP